MNPPERFPDAERRRFLKAGSLLVSFTLCPSLHAAAQPAAPAAPPPPGSLKTTPWLDAWIKLDESGRITVFTGKAELGTGVKTALTQIAAEQLDVAPEAIVLVTADTALTPNEGYTAGSHTLADSGTAILNATARLRALLQEAAATQLRVDATQVVVEDGWVSVPDGRRLTYAQAVAGVDLHRRVEAAGPLKDPRTYRVIGQSTPRVDMPAKVTGGVSYVQDLRLPGMVHARVVRPPAPGATLAQADLAGVRAMPGVLKVVQDGSFLGVVADDEWAAILAMRALAASARWHAASTALPAPETLHAALRALPAQDIALVDARAPQAASSSPAARTLRARYSRPYLMHAAVGPSCAVALLDGAHLTVWTHTQGVFPLRHGLAEMLAMPPDNVHCIQVQGSGCYGHNGADDVAADAALLARAFAGRPVRVQWMREQEHQWEPYGPAMLTEASATLDAGGNVIAWRYEIWSNPHNERIVNAGRLMPAWLLARPFTPAPPQPIPMPEGGGDRNGIPLYRFPDSRGTFHFLPRMPLRTSALRSLGAHMNVFSIESFIDELADAAHADPVEFRLRHLDDPRAREVIQAAASRAGWQRRIAGQLTPSRHGAGFAFAQYKNLMAYVAIALELDVERESGDVRIGRVVAAVDCGQIVNPDGVRNQIEGGIIQSASWTLYEQLRFDRQGVTSFDWDTYPIMRFPATPATIDVVLIDRPGLPFLGVGEAAQGPMAGALANAIADATGQRLRDLPLAGARLKAALGP